MTNDEQTPSSGWLKAQLDSLGLPKIEFLDSKSNVLVAGTKAFVDFSFAVDANNATALAQIQSWLKKTPKVTSSSAIYSEEKVTVFRASFTADAP